MSSALSRRGLLERAGLAAIASSGLYGFLDELVPSVADAAVAGARRRPEQHLPERVRLVRDNNVSVVVPPLHHRVVTTRLTVPRRAGALREAQRVLERQVRLLESEAGPGLDVTIAWGLPYFARYLPRLANGARYPDYLPHDLEASRTAGSRVSAVLDAIRFPSDPASTILEHNDVAFLFSSDSLAAVEDGAQALFASLSGILRLTSVRKGFVGGGFGGRRSLPKKMAMKARIPGAELIPADAQLFLGFTSTQQGALGPGRIANFETLPGFTDQWPRGPFRGGTAMHLSHVFEDVELWYTQYNEIRRMWQAMDAGRAEFVAGPATLPSGPDAVQSFEELQAFAIRDADGNDGIAGHSATMQPVNRLATALRDNHGTAHRQGTAVLQRSDFNTLDNPFFWSAAPRLDRYRTTPRAGLHFVAFSPTTDFFHRLRRAMDGRYADGTVLPLSPHSAGLGMNSVLRTTHRQNFLVPPRARRAFPLAELA